MFIYDGADGVRLVFVHDERGVDAPSDAPFGGAISVDLRGLPDGERAVLQAQLVNRGHASDTVPVTFTVRGITVERRNVTVSAGSTRTVEFDRDLERTGTWELGVNDQLVDVHVEPPSPRLAVNSLDVEPSRVEAGEPIQVAATVENVGQESGAVTVNPGLLDESRIEVGYPRARRGRHRHVRQDQRRTRNPFLPGRE